MDESFAEPMAFVFFIQGLKLLLQRRHSVLIQSHCLVASGQLLLVVLLDSRIENIVVAFSNCLFVAAATSEAAWFNAKHDRNES